MNKKIIFISVIVFTVLIVLGITILNTSSKYNEFFVSENKWNSIKESRVENKNLVLEDIKFNDYKLIIDKKNNTLYYSIKKDSKSEFNPNVSYSASNKNINLAIFSDEITDEKVKSNYQFKIMIYDEKEYNIFNLKCTDFPILNISYNENEEIEQNTVPMEMYLLDNLSNMPNKITISSGKVKEQEDNYIFSLNMLTPGKNKRENKISLLNMKPSNKYLLTKVNIISDNSEIMTNNRVELFLNSEYKGVYNLKCIEEKIRNDR